MHNAPAGGEQLSAATATSRQRGAGIVMMLTSSASNQTGAALGALAFPAIGPVGVVAVRQFVTAIVLTPIVRPNLRGLRKDQWWPILGLVVVFSVMNLSLYAAIDRIGLGLAVTLEFLGPLTVAIASSRRVLDIACAVLAGAGVLVLTNPGPTADIIGITTGTARRDGVGLLHPAQPHPRPASSRPARNRRGRPRHRRRLDPRSP
ncbi:hypothetical protein [Streptomyces yanii]|uniref:EamA family transporter n=1 Tax=Streptomyces yanii TaxID=78510 RepID=UPI0031E8B267